MTAPCDKKKTPELLSEQDNDLPFQILDEDGNPEKLTVGAGLVEITVQLPTTVANAPKQFTKTGGAVTVIDGETGRASCRVTVADMVLLKLVKDKPQNWVVLIDKTGPVRKAARFLVEDDKGIILQPLTL